MHIQDIPPRDLLLRICRPIITTNNMECPECAKIDDYRPKRDLQRAESAANFLQSESTTVEPE